jgi:hypothetical protein
MYRLHWYGVMLDNYVRLLLTMSCLAWKMHVEVTCLTSTSTLLWQNSLGIKECGVPQWWNF